MATTEILQERRSASAARLDNLFSASPREYGQYFWRFLVFALSLAYLCIFRRFTTRDLDEGIILQAAERVLRGQVPYRDFFLFYTPGSVYIQAALFRVFGDSFLVARTGVALIGAACSTLTYSLARRTCSLRMSLVAAGLSTMVGVTYRFVVVHNWYSTLFAMLAIYAAVRVVETGSRTWAFIAGALAAATVLIEQSKGAGLCLGLLLGYVVLHLLRPVKTEFRLGAFVVGFIGPCVVTAVCFTSHHAFGIMLKDWFWPLQHYTQANRVFYGHLSWSDGVRNNLYTGPIAIRISEIITLSPLLIVPVLPLAGVAWLAWWIKQVWRGGDRSGEAAHYVLVSACAAGMLLCILVVRTDITDFMYLAPLWFVILAFLLTRRATRFRLLARLRPFALAYICLSFSALGFGLLLSVNGATVKTHARRGVIFTANEEHTVPAIQTAIPPGGQLLVYPYLPLYNYLTETTSPATLDFFQPGMNTLDQAQGMVQALEESQTAWVLFDPEFVTKITDVWPHTELKTIVEDPVGVYLAQHYRICQILRAGPGLSFQLMTLKDRPCGSVTVSSPMKPVNKSTHVRRPLFSKS